MTGQECKGLENGGRRKENRFTDNDDKGLRRTNRYGHCRRRGVGLRARAPVGVDTRLDLRGHCRRNFSHQSGLFNMKILAIEKEYDGKAVEDFQPHLEAEARRVWELYKKGVIREIYFRADRADAVLILECENLKEAKETLSTLPLVKEDLIYFDFIPLAAYSGFERLFKAK